MYLFDNFKYKIFCDMDGVLVDFRKGYKELTGIDIGDEYHSTDEFWTPINNAGKEFWENLEWMPDGQRLWNYLGEYYPILLSSPSRKGFGSREGKKNWVDREMPGTPLIMTYSFHKQKYSGPNNILIDDRDSNIEEWISKGGIGILHTSTEETIKELNNLGL